MAALSFAFPVPASFQQKLDAVEAFRAIPKDEATLEELDVPEIVVLGKQACGKSSILEGIAGIALPRGENLVTRGPINLRLRRDAAATTPFAIVSRDPQASTGDKIFDLETELEEKIQQIWDEMVAEQGTILTEDPVFVTVFRLSGISLNLQDLPGIAEQGDTPEARKSFLNTSTEIARKHIMNSRAIIVLVVPATERDFANSSALTLALECDPKRSRTLGVMTSIDGVNEEDLFQVVMRRIEGRPDADVNLPLGWTAVKCRSGTERKEKILAATAETNYFENDPFGKRVPACKRSLKVVVGRICTIQEPYLDSWIPLAQAQVGDRLLLAKDALDRCESTDATSLDDFRWKMTSVVMTVAEKLTKLIKAEDMDDRIEMHVCARVHEMFQTFKKAMLEDATSFFQSSESYASGMQTSSASVDADGRNFIKSCIEEALGAHREDFISPLADRRIVRAFICKTLRQHTETLLVAVQTLLKKVVSVLWEETMSRFPSVCRRLAPHCGQIVLQLAKEAQDPIFAVVEAEEENDFTQGDNSCNSIVAQIREQLVNKIFASNGPFCSQLQAGIVQYWPQCQISHVNYALEKAKPNFLSELQDVQPGQLSQGGDRVNTHRILAQAYCLEVIHRCGDIFPILIKQRILNKAPQFIQHHITCKMELIGYDELMKAHKRDSTQYAQLQSARELVGSLQNAQAALQECLEYHLDKEVTGNH